MKSRDALFPILIGTNGTGKTSYEKLFIKFNKRNLIIPANKSDSNRAWSEVPEIPVDGILTKVTGLTPLDWDQLSKPHFRKEKHKMQFFMHQVFEAMNGTYKIVINSRNKILVEIIMHDELGFVKGGLFLDDFKNYIKHNNCPGYVEQLLSDRRHKELDIFAATHSPNKIPPVFFDHEPQIVLWRTTRNFHSAREKITPELMEQLEAARIRINRLKLTPPISPYEIIKIPEA